MGLEVFWRESAPAEGHDFAGGCYGGKGGFAVMRAPNPLSFLFEVEKVHQSSHGSLIKILKWIPLLARLFLGRKAWRVFRRSGVAKKMKQVVRRRMGLQIDGLAGGAREGVWTLSILQCGSETQLAARGKHGIHQMLSLVSTTFVYSSREQKLLTVGDSVFPPSRLRAGWPRIPLGGKPRFSLCP
jgi:hypothetical protein